MHSRSFSPCCEDLQGKPRILSLNSQLLPACCLPGCGFLTQHSHLLRLRIAIPWFHLGESCCQPLPSDAGIPSEPCEKFSTLSQAAICLQGPDTAYTQFLVLWTFGSMGRWLSFGSWVPTPWLGSHGTPMLLSSFLCIFLPCFIDNQGRLLPSPQPALTFLGTFSSLPTELLTEGLRG